jgi:hypothetical protein
VAILATLYQKAYALEETYFKGSTLDVPYREQAVIVGKEGFYPGRIVVFKGAKLAKFIRFEARRKVMRDEIRDARCEYFYHKVHGVRLK